MNMSEVGKRNYEDFPLSQSQRLILTGQQLQPSDPLYNMLVVFHIEGTIDEQRFKQAFTQLINQCDALRIIFPLPSSSQEPFQRVLSDFDYQLKYLDFSDNPMPKATYDEWVSQRKVMLFELTECLFDSALIKLEAQKYVWYFNHHHLLTDAWSTELLFKQLSENYSLMGGATLEVVSSLADFSKAVLAEHKKLDSKQVLRASDYWQSRPQLEQANSQFYRNTSSVRSSKTFRFECELGKERYQGLSSLAQHAHFQSFSEELTTMQVFATLLVSYLYRLNPQKTIVIGTPVHSRTNKSLKNTVGCLINIFPLIIEVDAADTFLSLYQKIAEANQALLMNAVAGSNSPELNRSFDVVLNFIPSTFGDFAGMPVRSEWIHTDSGDRNHLLRLQVQNFDQQDTFTLYFDLNQDTFINQENTWVGQQFLQLIDGLLDDAEQSIAQVELGDKADKVVYQNLPLVTKQEKKAESVVELFVNRNERFSQHNALVCKDLIVSYSDLLHRSEQLARYIVTQTLPKNAIIGVMMDRSIHAVVCIYAILRAGHAFLPIDPKYPQARIDYILQDASVDLVFVDESLSIATADTSAKVCLIEDVWQSIGELSLTNVALPKSIDLASLAYVIYTSGSTGKPKGVEVSHGNLVNYIEWAAEYYLQGESLNFALFSSLSFDLTITSLFVPLVTGGALHIYPEPKDSSEIVIRTVIEDNQVDVIKLTPSHLSLIQVMDFSQSTLKKLIVGGENFKTELAQTIDKYFAGNIAIYNEYGPTEATVACAVHQYNPQQDTQVSVPIGQPINGANVFILDEYFHLVPQGVSGELYISGKGLAKGYLNQAALTAERFIQMNSVSPERLYKSGDLVKFNHHGQVECLGRIDQQIKVHGVRIESAEIEAALSDMPSIQSAVVELASQIDLNKESDEIEHCVKCGLAANHPSARLNEQQICRICRNYLSHESQALSYYRQLDDLQNWIDKIKRQSSSKQDSIMLLSGGKDSSYALCKLVDMGLTPIVFTLDNGFISEGAKANVRRLVDRLGLELVEGKTSAMNDIFVDSLKRFSNVCNGCFKTIYTMSMTLAKERGIKVICTGLSRGQIFETRVAHLFQQGCFDPEKIDEKIIEARKAYHLTDDIIASTFDVSIFKDEQIFQDIQYLDFYRYADVTLDEMYDYLNNIAPWIRPSDTGRSTNCLINDAGIYVHKKERGYHNYALPYSWDVRLGHKERNAALDELDDELDLKKVTDILQQVGYQSQDIKPTFFNDEKLIGYYVSSAEIQKNDLQKHLLAQLPKEYVPSHFVWLKSMPLTANGKIDRSALPRPRLNLRDISTDYVAPQTDTEVMLSHLWSQLLGVKEVGLDDNFFDLGGDSIVNIQIVASAREKGVTLAPQQIFDFPTIRQLVKVAKVEPQIAAEQGEIIGDVSLLPSQASFFEKNPSGSNQFSQSVVVQCNQPLTKKKLIAGLQFILQQHDLLRAAFVCVNKHWQQRILPWQADLLQIERTHVGDNGQLFAEIEFQKKNLAAKLDVGNAQLLAACLIDNPSNQQSVIVLTIHHLVMDGVSWWILLNELNEYLDTLNHSQEVILPTKSCSIPQWLSGLQHYMNGPRSQSSSSYWKNYTAQQNVDSKDVILDTLQVQPKTSQVQEVDIINTLSTEQTELLIASTNHQSHFIVPDVLIATLVLTLSKDNGVDLGAKSFTLDIEGHGREDIGQGVDIGRTIGWFTSIHPLFFDLTQIQKSGLGNVFNMVRKTVKDVPNNGFDYYLQQQSSDDFVHSSHGNILFNYLGQWEKSLVKGSSFKFLQPITADYAGTRLHHHAVEFNGVIFGGKLQITWTYDASRIEQVDMNKFIQAYVAQLERVISDSLQNKPEQTVVISDPSINNDELGDIFAEFGE